ncbi:hypothetical protein BC834DRAFT_668314, partial [Gloeopeniophorella convolvens]
MRASVVSKQTRPLPCWTFADGREYGVLSGSGGGGGRRRTWRARQRAHWRRISKSGHCLAIAPDPNNVDGRPAATSRHCPSEDSGLGDKHRVSFSRASRPQRLSSAPVPHTVHSSLEIQSVAGVDNQFSPRPRAARNLYLLSPAVRDQEGKGLDMAYLSARLSPMATTGPCVARTLEYPTLPCPWFAYCRDPTLFTAFSTHHRLHARWTSK